MSFVRLLGFATLPCGCIVGRYRDLASRRELAYIEEKGRTCEAREHRRNHTVQAPQTAAAPSRLVQAQAS